TLATTIPSRLASAQEATLAPGGGQQMLLQSSDFEDCSWGLFKSDPIWGFLYIEFIGSRSYATSVPQGYDTETIASITIHTTYLPSESITCRVDDMGIESGPIYTPYGTTSEVQHTNSACDGYPPLTLGDHHSTRNYIDESVGGYSTVLDGILSG